MWNLTSYARLAFVDPDAVVVRDAALLEDAALHLLPRSSSVKTCPDHNLTTRPHHELASTLA